MIFPGPGDDDTLDNLVNGSADADTIDGGGGNDTLNGLGGNDRVSGRTGDDTVNGGSGDDSISGGELGNDLVDGGSGNDTIYESQGLDTLIGGGGNDLIFVRDGSTAAGGSGSDTLVLGASNAINLGLTVGQDALSGGDGVDLLIVGGTVVFAAASFHAVAAGFERIQADNAFLGDNSDNVLDFSGLALIGSKGLNINAAQGDDEVRGLDSSIGDLLLGGGGNDALYGFGGADVLGGGDGNDAVHGGAGNDEIWGYNDPGTTAADQLFGEAGNDEIRASGQGSAVGGSGRDLIHLVGALVLDDKIFGDDPLDAAATGNDTLSVESNTVFAAAHFSMKDASFEYLVAVIAIRGDDGANHLDFSAALLDAGAPVPLFFGQGGDDTISATSAADIVRGGGGNDSLLGNGGNDTLRGEEHDDTLEGGDGNDFLDGSAQFGTLESNQLFGDAGNDTIISVADDRIVGGAGNDEVRVENAVVHDDRCFGDDPLNLLANGNDTLRVDGSTVFAVTRFSMLDASFEYLDVENSITGDDGDNELDFSSAILTTNASNHPAFFGRGGNDTISATGGNDTVQGESGNDSLLGSAGNDLMFGGFHNDTLHGGLGNDSLEGGAGIDHLFGDGGNDTLTDSDQILFDGGEGNDLLKILGGLLKAGAAQGGAGTDIIQVDGFSIVQRFEGLDQGFERLGAGSSLFGNGKTNVIDLSGLTVLPGAAPIVFGQGGDDRLLGPLGGVRIDGNAGNDFIFAPGNNSTLNGGDNDDTLSGGTGRATLDGGPGIDTASWKWLTGPPPAPPPGAAVLAAAAAGVRVDLSQTGAQNTGLGILTMSNIENVDGSALDDTITGNGAANVLLGFAGNDVLAGGLGDDLLNGGAGSDAASFAGAAAAVTADLSVAGPQNTGEGLDTFVSIENLTGSANGDGLTGSSAANVLSGGAGSDTMDGGGGADTLTGNGGKDLLTGGAGPDTFRFLAPNESGTGIAARDVITDFTPGSDVIDLSAIDAMAATAGIDDAFTFIGSAAFTAEGQVRVEQSGADVLVEVNTTGASGAEMRIELQAITAALIDQFDFVL